MKTSIQAAWSELANGTSAVKAVSLPLPRHPSRSAVAGRLLIHDFRDLPNSLPVSVRENDDGSWPALITMVENA